MFVLLSALLLATNGMELALLECKNTFQSEFNAAVAAKADECEAFQHSSQCFTNAIITSTESFETVLRDIETLVADIVRTPTSCDLRSLPFFQDIPSTHPGTFSRKARSLSTTFDLVDQLAAQQQSRYSIQSGGNAALAALSARLNAAYNSYTNIVNNVFTAAVNRFANRISLLQGVLSSLRPNLDLTLSPSVSTAQSAITAQLSQETSTRLIVQAQISTNIASLSTTVSGGVNFAIADRSNIRSTIQYNNPINTINSQLSTQYSTEASRQVAKSTAQTTSFNNLQTAFNASLSSGVLSQGVFDDAACRSAVAASVWKPQWLSSINDGGSCSVAGQYYYSHANRTIFFCTGGIYTPLIPSLVEGYWQGNTFLSEQQAYQIKLQVGLTQTWNLCWRMSLHGNQAATYRSNCGGKGSTTMLIGKSTDGRIWGAWTNVGITGTCTGCWYGQTAENCWWYRMNPYAPTEIQILNQYEQTTCLYEGTNYCPYYYDGRFSLGTSGTCNTVFYDSYSDWFINPYAGDANKNFAYGSNAGYFATTGTTSIIDAEMWYR